MSDVLAAPSLSRLLYEPVVDVALREDLGTAGDLTSSAVLAEGLDATAAIVARAAGRICGMEVARSVFTRLDPDIRWTAEVREGADVTAGQRICLLSGRARSILSGERTALNFLGHLSGVATATRALVAAIADWPARLVDTRKTTPGLRVLEKYAVRVGGGSNHRWGLYDAVLIKDNHVLAAGGITPAVERARRAVGHLVKIELEVDDLDQVREALSLGVDALLLDNMGLDELREAVETCRGRALTEASGGIGPDTVAEVAATGVDIISAGWVTHSAACLDVGLDLIAVEDNQAKR